MARLCIHCRWAKNMVPQLPRLEPSDIDWVCMHVSSLRPARPPSPVTGKTAERRPLGCREVRMMEHDYREPRTTYCGAEGRYWEPIEAGFGQP
jgi:hypothetical protein